MVILQVQPSSSGLPNRQFLESGQIEVQELTEEHVAAPTMGQAPDLLCNPCAIHGALNSHVGTTADSHRELDAHGIHSNDGAPWIGCADLGNHSQPH